MAGEASGSGKGRLGKLSESEPPRLTKVKPEAESAAVGPTSAGGDGAAQSEKVTTGGVRKVKFAPKIPAARKRATQVKEEGADDALHQSIYAAAKDGAGPRGRTVQPQGRRFQQDKKKGPKDAPVALDKAAYTKSDGHVGDEQRASDLPDDFKKALQGTAKMGPEDLIEDVTKYYPTVLRDHDTATNYVDSRTTAQQLHLDMDQIGERISLLQFPSILPTEKVLDENGEEEGAPMPTVSGAWPNALENLPSGKMGKLLIYESGAVKMKLGELLFDIAPGTQIMAAQQLAAVDATSTKAVFLGDVYQRIVVTPDIDQLLAMPA
mmetsp:Transcript_15302/g.25853  ORF Transcript_15302/g.25853 Transcript_15302/m.25853 type:complete len:322 (-) Transcript_15302:152-1117(-)|eukprot:CAMPEP_0198204614 /NCGR_PEP_ID=MMETSP1445-20131203/8031_1 /TAXON_ID=36898 /ORGANISM="Pyramimonas sp., Strain CCMP2087" /LENGTH=321 /DNA_ID=CAMNT_0043876565 /DNA_START=182 /DNA_END=1147 /DNA_ORIENTATION=-